MGNELVTIERHLQHVEPQLHNALSGLMPTKRLIQTVLVSCENNARILESTPDSILRCAMTFAVLGLPVDGATGQGFLLPFKNKGAMRAQACIGYKGYNTLGARAHLSITGGTVREDDLVFDYMLGDNAFLNHKPRLGSQARIIAFWAVAACNDRPPIISILSIGDVIAIKEKSPAVRANAETPWNDPRIGFPAMGEKSAKRRLARSTPLITEAPQFMMGARMEEAFEEQERGSWITPDCGVVIDGDLATRHSTETPTAAQLIDSPQSPPARPAANEPAPSQSPPASGAGDDIDDLTKADQKLADAAALGMTKLQEAWDKLPNSQRVVLKSAKDRRHKPAALAADAARDPAE